jgi:hypothetical protein
MGRRRLGEGIRPETAARFWGAALSLAALASCGGGDGGGSGGGGSPTPAPTPPASPTPTPTPGPSYTAFADLTGDEKFPTACQMYAPSGNGMPGGSHTNMFNDFGMIDYTAADQSWRVLNETFHPADLVSSSSTEIRYERAAVLRRTEKFVITRPTSAGAAAVYGRTSEQYLVDDSGFWRAGYCVLGVPTLATDIPAATTVTYSDLVIDGLIYELVGSEVEVSKITGGSGSLVGTTTTGELSISFHYNVTAPNGATTVVGPVQGSVSVNLTEGRAGYWGVIGAAPEYWLYGGFFGPQGKETGFVASQRIDQDSNGLNEKYVIFRVFARR